MGNNIDDALARLSSATPHEGLAGLEDRVLGAISSQPASGLGTGATLAATGLALVLGLVSNAIPSSAARAAPALSPLGAPSPLAPSALLGGTQ
ncbi:MAG: hypothetical protein P0Y59_10235 [Candidatus Sphingomonas phytovorans]|nr:hypothetical protein [Sphingomonas sp.]WEK02030.1 MAG: hypothetical protein P0Y59_10235 [Sphingomonas sp.]